MRKPSIKPSTLRLTNQTLYCISFNSELRWEYTNKRLADRKAKSLNKYLTVKLQSANVLLVSLYSILRRLYFTLEVIDSNNLSNQIRDVESSIGFAISKSGYENGCWYTFGFLSNIFGNLLLIGEQLHRHSEKRKITSDIWVLKSEIKIIEYLIEDLNVYSKSQKLEVKESAGEAIIRKLG